MAFTFIRFIFVNMNNRIKEIITALKLTDGEFADKVGIKRSTLSHCLSGRNDVSKEIIVKIHNALPDVSINWLMFGEGEPGFTASAAGAEPEINTGLFKSLQDIPPVYELRHEYSKENDSKPVPEAVEPPDNKGLEVISDTADNLIKVESKKSDNRKIDKIIVFYTDNTFEIYNSN